MNRKSLSIVWAFVFTSLLLGTSIVFTKLTQHAQASNHDAITTSPFGWRQVNTDGFGDSDNIMISSLEVFHGKLYAGTFNYDLGGSIYRTSNGTAWTQATEPGFGDVYTNTNRAISDMVVFNDRLYASTAWGDSPGQIWRSDDGTSWNPIVVDGFANPENKSVSVMTIFSNTIYAAVGDNPSGLQIWRSSTGNIGTWEKVVNNGFDNDTHTRVVCGAAEMNSYLYVSVENTTDGLEVWRTNNGTNWSQVNQDGFDDIANGETGGLALFNGYLYSGTRNDITGTQVWRSSNGTTWEKVIGNGFGNSGNYKTNLLFPFNSYIYAGVNNDTTGVKIWRSSDGVIWNQMIDDGFGDSNNTGIEFSNTTASYQNALYIGMLNASTGGEIWEQLRQVFLPLVTRQ